MIRVPPLQRARKEQYSVKVSFLTFFEEMDIIKIIAKVVNFAANSKFLSKLFNIVLMNQEQSLIRYAVSKIKDQDILHRAFLKPFEIALKTSRTQSGTGHKLLPTSLPSGLKIAVKESITNNKYDLMNVGKLEESDRWCELKSKFHDNFLSLFKCSDGIELSICVCIYSQDVKMLKQTLAGVAENISNIVLREKVSSDKIGVFVIIDGVEKISASVVDYFEELERRNNINLGPNIAPTLTVDEMVQRVNMTEQEINQEEFKNVNNFLFDAAELNDRNQRRFSSVYNQFQEIRKLQQAISKLKKGKARLDQLPFKLRPSFISELRERYKRDYSLSEQQVCNFSEEKLISEYQNDESKMKPIIMKVLNDGDRYCSQYSKTRDDLAYLAYFPNKINHNFRQINVRKSRFYEQDQSNQLRGSQQPATTTMNLFLCVKYKNTGKLSSHNWFINGFCKELRPKYSVLLDVGLRPQPEALFKMYTYMNKYQTVGGVCGYMGLKIEMLQEKDEMAEQEIDLLTSISMKFADIQRTQQVEYHFAHLLDKPFESFFNFIHVLPGAFSAYNMRAILDYDNDQDDELLRQYFKSVEDKIKTTQMHHTKLSVSSILLRTLLPDMINCCVELKPESDQQMLYNQNIYLAEDRILCLGIFKKNYKLAYLPDAYAQVDPIKTLHDLLGQRKRWINGSFFAFEKVKKQLKEHEKANDYNLFLHLQIFYLTVMNALLYFAPSFFLFTIHIAMEAFRDDALVKVLSGTVRDPNTSEFYNAFVYTIDFIYVLLMLSIIFFSLHLKSTVKKFKTFLYGVSTVLGIFSISVFIVLLTDVLRGLLDESSFLIQNQASIASIPGGMIVLKVLRWILVGSMGIFILPIFIYLLLFGKFHILVQIILGSFSILFYGPTYINILYMYSLCRIDDISWGTKGLDSNASSANQKLTSSWKSLKYLHVSKYVAWNIVLSVILLSFGSSYIPRIFITIIILAVMALSQSIKVILAILYFISYKVRISKCCQQVRYEYQPQESRIKEIIDLHKNDVLEEVKSHLQKVEAEYSKDVIIKVPGGSFIQQFKSKKIVQKCFQKKKKEFQRISQIIRQPQEKKYKVKMSTIPQQQHSSGKKKSPPSKGRQLSESFSSNQSFHQLSPEKLLPKK